MRNNLGVFLQACAALSLLSLASASCPDDCWLRRGYCSTGKFPYGTDEERSRDDRAVPCGPIDLFFVIQAPIFLVASCALAVVSLRYFSATFGARGQRPFSRIGDGGAAGGSGENGRGGGGDPRADSGASSPKRRPVLQRIGTLLGFIFGVCGATYSLIRVVVYTHGVPDVRALNAVRNVQAILIGVTNICLASSCYLTVILWYGLLSDNITMNSGGNGRRRVFLGHRGLRLAFFAVVITFGTFEILMRLFQVNRPESAGLGLSIAYYGFTILTVGAAVALSTSLARKVSRHRSATMELRRRNAASGAAPPVDPVGRALVSMYAIAVMGALLVVATFITVPYMINRYTYPGSFTYFVVADFSRLPVAWIIAWQCRPNHL